MGAWVGERVVEIMQEEEQRRYRERKKAEDTECGWRGKENDE